MPNTRHVKNNRNFSLKWYIPSNDRYVKMTFRLKWQERQNDTLVKMTETSKEILLY